MKTTTLPPLTRQCNSWILTSPDGTEFYETWEPHYARALVERGWTVRTAYDHLCALNEKAP